MIDTTEINEFLDKARIPNSLKVFLRDQFKKASSMMDPHDYNRLVTMVKERIQQEEAKLN